VPAADSTPRNRLVLVSDAPTTRNSGLT
jgi:hypothetical protein